jgi:hypothetical protein
MKTTLVLLAALSAAVVAIASGCSSGDDDDDGAAGSAAVGGGAGTGGSGTSGSGGSGATGKGGSAGQGGSSGSSAGTGNTGGSAGKGGSGGDAGAPISTGGTSGDAGATNGAGGSTEGGAAGATGMELVGVCAHRAEATVTVDDFTGYEEYVLIGDEGFGEDICVVRFDVTRVGAAPEGCTDCLWSHLVERGNPTVVIDENGVCGTSELGLDATAIAELDGSQVAYGFVPELDGHASIALTHIEASNSWEAYNNATWNEDTGRFRFDRRNGACTY